MIGDTAWAALNQALKKVTPECDGDRRYILDNPSEIAQSAMRIVCCRCLIEELCSAYATATKPLVGFWAGKHYQSRLSRK